VKAGANYVLEKLPDVSGLGIVKAGANLDRYVHMSEDKSRVHMSEDKVCRKD